ncbi:hypothetical protein EIN_252130 [Entamoeba invadens IP1]|uniref:DH domain-containing protein n=1 Tax=Entamoeba invadens IP1 TaxID=370355 RepID=A0A0A1UGN2_ENTIV|nr:hypothetical protein EIN_252130 [Entamoeba invadens IP1]ELP95009.1 hypothetical protein EIN_252130 [Entamoeba invadens IP1]|eukprot:XP_004261780.1 hypothetical protein EIN_252130 [Entamoeba invadens IP1]
MIGVEQTQNVDKYYSAWFSYNTRPVTQVIRFEVNGNLFELDKSVVTMERVEKSVLQYVLLKKKDEVDRGDIIHIPGNRTEEKQWKIYFNYISGECIYDRLFSLRKAIEKVVVLLYFGVSLPEILVYLGVSRETQPLIVGRLLMVMDKRMVSSITQLDKEKTWSDYFRRGVQHLVKVPESLTDYYSNSDNVKTMCEYYGLRSELDTMIEEKVKQVEENERSRIPLSLFFGSLGVKKETNVVDMEKMRRLNEMKKKKNFVKINVEEIRLDKLSNLIYCQRRIRLFVSYSKYSFRLLQLSRNHFTEYVDTERSFCNWMKLFKEVFRDKFMVEVNAGHMEQSTVDGIFLNLLAVIENSEKLERELRPYVTKFRCDTCTGKAIEDTAKFVGALVPFTNDYQPALETFNSVKETPMVQSILIQTTDGQNTQNAANRSRCQSEFEAFKQQIGDGKMSYIERLMYESLEAKLKACPNAAKDFTSLLIMPAQRCMRYGTMLEPMVKDMGKLHPDYAPTVSAYKCFKTFAKYTNDNGAMRSALINLAKTFNYTKLAVLGRYLSKQEEGEYEKEKHVIFLLNDSIAFVKEKVYIQAKTKKDKTKVKPLQFQINHQTTVKRSIDTLMINNVVEISNTKSGKTSLAIKLSSVEVAKTWEEEINVNVSLRFFDLNYESAWLDQYKKK